MHLHRPHKTFDRNELPTRAKYTQKQGRRYVVIARTTSTTGEHKHALGKEEEVEKRRRSGECESNDVTMLNARVSKAEVNSREVLTRTGVPGLCRSR
jgi:hypothetical protein|tara:strand:- start:1128 stop:1418 length:291 start_codon:yes stop_codon:yes gene_type:complete